MLKLQVSNIISFYLLDPHDMPDIALASNSTSVNKIGKHPLALPGPMHERERGI